MTNNEQKFNIFIIVEHLHISESENDALYDQSGQTKREIKTIIKKKCTEPAIKKKKKHAAQY